MQNYAAFKRYFWRYLEVWTWFLYLFCFFSLKSGLIFKSPVATLHCRPLEAYATCSVRINEQWQYISVFIRDHVMHPNTSVNSVNNIISNLIFSCNNCDANRAFVQIVKARQRRRVVVYLMQNLRLRGRPPPIIFVQIVRSMNALQLCRKQFSHKETL